MGAGASIDADLAAAADKATRDIEQLVPKTASGQFDPTRADPDAVREVVDRATKLARHGYKISWEYYKRTDVEGLLADTSRLSDDFTPAVCTYFWSDSSSAGPSSGAPKRSRPASPRKPIATTRTTSRACATSSGRPASSTRRAT